MNIKRLLRLVIAIIMVLIFLLQIVSSQEKNLERYIRRRPKNQKSFLEIFNITFPKQIYKKTIKSYALVIGIGKYKNLDQLQSPARDIEKMTNFLLNEDGFDEVVVLNDENARKGLIDTLMEDYFPKLINNTNVKSRFLFYFSGHGKDRDIGSGKLKGYLRLINETKNNYSNSIDMSMIENWCKNLNKAQHVLFIIDACFSGLAGLEIKTEYNDQASASHLLTLSGKHMITAGGTEEKALGSVSQWGGSLFTDVIINMMRGSADKNKDGVVTVVELYEYTNNAVQNESQTTMHPQWSNLGNPNSDKGGFFFLTRDNIIKKYDRGKNKNEKKSEETELDTTMILIPGGEFVMGTSDEEITQLLKEHPDWDRKWFEDEMPAHKVKIDSFYMDKYEVTNEQFTEFLNKWGRDTDENGNKMIYEHNWGINKKAKKWKAQKGYEKHPVIFVTWYGAKQYAKEKGKQLPSEAEWEYSARCSLQLEYATLNGQINPTLANYIESNNLITAQVGSYLPNSFGLYDLSGNVWEWCEDSYKPYQNYGLTETINDTTIKVVRGGSWKSEEYSLRCAKRYKYETNKRYDFVGFRCVKDNKQTN